VRSVRVTFPPPAEKERVYSDEPGYDNAAVATIVDRLGSMGRAHS